MEVAPPTGQNAETIGEGRQLPAFLFRVGLIEDFDTVEPQTHQASYHGFQGAAGPTALEGMGEKDNSARFVNVGDQPRYIRRRVVTVACIRVTVEVDPYRRLPLVYGVRHDAYSKAVSEL